MNWYAFWVICGGVVFLGGTTLYAVRLLQRGE